MFDFRIHSHKPGYTLASLRDFTGYVAFDTRVEGADIGCRVSGMMVEDGHERRSGFSVGVDATWGSYFHVTDAVRVVEVQP